MLLPLAIPMVITQVSQVAMSFVDTIMASHASLTDMSGVALASSMFVPVALTCMGILMVLGPIIAHLSGEGKQKRISHYMNQSFWLAGILSVIAMAILWNADLFIHHITTDPELSRICLGYLDAVLWGIPAFMGFVCLRSLNEGLSMTKPAMIVGFIGLMVNIPGNYIFVFGKFGAPALGGIGCGVATAIVFWAMFISLLIAVLTSKKHKFYRTLTIPHRPRKSSLFTVLKIGIPVALAMLCEVGLFSASALLLGKLGTEQVGAHQVAINISSLLFIIPLSIGTGVSIRVAHNLGERKIEAVGNVMRTGYSLAVIFAICTAILVHAMIPAVPFLYRINDTAVLQLAASLLFFCSLYQIPDACNMMGTSILRGFKDTLSLMFITFFSFWIVALPVGYILGRTDLVVPHMGAKGFWIGFIVGLSTSAVLMGWRVRHTWKKTIARHRKSTEAAS